MLVKNYQVLRGGAAMASKMDKAINMMVYTNLTQREIAEKLDVREETISRWKNREDFKSKKKEEEGKFLFELTSPAMRTMRELLNSHSDYVRFQAAQDILDRTGYKPTDKVDLSSDLTLIFEDDYGD